MQNCRRSQRFHSKRKPVYASIVNGTLSGVCSDKPLEAHTKHQPREERPVELCRLQFSALSTPARIRWDAAKNLSAPFLDNEVYRKIPPIQRDIDLQELVSELSKLSAASAMHSSVRLSPGVVLASSKQLVCLFSRITLTVTPELAGFCRVTLIPAQNTYESMETGS